jgi:hypothetical protein
VRAPDLIGELALHGDRLVVGGYFVEYERKVYGFDWYRNDRGIQVEAEKRNSDAFFYYFSAGVFEDIFSGFALVIRDKEHAASDFVMFE